MLHTLTALTLSLVPSISQANYMNGNELLAFCDSDPTLTSGYFLGVFDTFQALNSNLGTPKICVPEGFSAVDGRIVVCSFLSSNPDRRDYSAATVIFSAFEEFHPCQ